MKEYQTKWHVHQLAGCVAYLLKEEKERLTFDELFNKAVNLNQFFELAKNPDWAEWAKNIVYSAMIAINW